MHSLEALAERRIITEALWVLLAYTKQFLQAKRNTVMLRECLCGNGVMCTRTEGVPAHGSAARHTAMCCAAASRRDVAVQVSCPAGPRIPGLLIE